MNSGLETALVILAFGITIFLITASLLLAVVVVFWLKRESRGKNKPVSSSKKAAKSSTSPEAATLPKKAAKETPKLTPNQSVAVNFSQAQNTEESQNTPSKTPKSKKVQPEDLAKLNTKINEAIEDVVPPYRFGLLQTNLLDGIGPFLSSDKDQTVKETGQTDGNLVTDKSASQKPSSTAPPATNSLQQSKKVPEIEPDAQPVIHESASKAAKSRKRQSQSKSSKQDSSKTVSKKPAKNETGRKSVSKQATAAKEPLSQKSAEESSTPKASKNRRKKTTSKKNIPGQSKEVKNTQKNVAQPSAIIRTPRRVNSRKASSVTSPANSVSAKSSKLQNFEFTPESKHAYELMNSPSTCVFVTGKAGTGKSYLLKYFKVYTTKNVVYLAPTGVAALNVGGQTIHKFFKFPARTMNQDEIQRVRNHKIYEMVDTIVIDEISMVRADMMDNIDRFLRLNGRYPDRPFGGTQMVFFGDLYQLPPVVGKDEEENKFLSTYYQSPYFFDAKVFDDLTVEVVELEKVYRQKDRQFIDLLNAVRLGDVTEQHITLVNQRYMPQFEPPPSERYTTLTPSNNFAAAINSQELAKLPYKSQKYVAITTGPYKELMKNLPTEVELILKKGAQVMFVKNDQSGRWVNGTVGVIHNLDDKEIYVEIFRDGQNYVYPVQREQWDLLKYRFDHTTRRIKSEVVASISQYPLKLAWAITIHKSQGMTLDNVIIDIGNGAFAHGQTYVALSRCKTFEGLRLKEQLLLTDIKVDPAICRVKERLGNRNNMGTKTSLDGLNIPESHPQHEQVTTMRDALPPSNQDRDIAEQVQLAHNALSRGDWPAAKRIVKFCEVSEYHPQYAEWNSLNQIITRHEADRTFKGFKDTSAGGGQGYFAKRDPTKIRANIEAWATVHKESPPPPPPQQD